MIPGADLQPLVERWLPTQRWFGGKGRDLRLDVVAVTEFTHEDRTVELWLADVEYADGGTDRYQVPLVTYPEPVDALDHVLIGSVKVDDSPLWIYDALHDKEVTGLWLDAVREARAAAPLSFHRYVGPEEVPQRVSSLVLTGEQSNTSLVYDDAAIMKVFRRLQPGVNPDIEIHAALGELGARHVARLLGSVDGDIDGQHYALAMVQEFLTTATDGWELAKTSVRDLMAERDLHAEEAGGDFAGEAFRLGTAVAQTHTDLAAAFGTSTAPRDVLRSRAEAMRSRLAQAVGLVPQLGELSGPLERAFADFAELDEDVAVQRIHGDLHLGQVLRTVHRWVIIDFEGEPMADITARRLPDTPLRDVAGMLRSFEYAGHHRVIESDFDTQLSYRAAEWTTRNRDAFCAGYAHESGTDPRERAALLRALEADKAVYEAVYEARNRPSWLPIPLASLTRLAEEAPQ